MSECTHVFFGHSSSSAPGIVLRPLRVLTPGASSSVSLAAACELARFKVRLRRRGRSFSWSCDSSIGSTLDSRVLLLTRLVVPAPAPAPARLAFFPPRAPRRLGSSPTASCSSPASLTLYAVLASSGIDSIPSWLSPPWSDSSSAVAARVRRAIGRASRSALSFAARLDDVSGLRLAALVDRVVRLIEASLRVRLIPPFALPLLLLTLPLLDRVTLELGSSAAPSSSSSVSMRLS